MKIDEIARLLRADVLVEGENGLQTEIKTACGSDMMSDVLAFVKDQALLLTGLVNPQVVRTAEMMDMSCIVFVRGKRPDASLLEMAKSRGITILATKMRMFMACGVLYSAGIHEGECGRLDE